LLWQRQKKNAYGNPIKGVKWKASPKEVVAVMQYKLRTDKQEKSAPSSKTESELQSQLHLPALQHDDPDHIEVPKPSRPQEMPTISVRERAMAASAPGTEYWLP
jgi:hypothetical protein